MGYASCKPADALVGLFVSAAAEIAMIPPSDRGSATFSETIETIDLGHMAVSATVWHCTDHSTSSPVSIETDNRQRINRLGI